LAGLILYNTICFYNSVGA